MKKKMTITDNKGRTTEITNEDTYVVVYENENGEPQLDENAYLNYDHDGYIGHDDCEGKGYGRRFLIDGVENEYICAVAREKVIAVISAEEFKKKVLELFA